MNRTVIRTIPIGSNIPVAPPANYDRAAWRASLNIPGDSLLVGYFGFMNATKGVETLLRGFAEVIQGGLDAYLLLIGGRTGTSDASNVATADRIEGLITELNLADRLRFTGFVEPGAVSAHLLACDLVALPYNDGVSYRRGSFMAALAHGCPIITTTPEVPHRELTNVVRLIPPESQYALAAAIRELADDPAARQSLGTRAKAFSARFSWDSIATQTLDFYREIVR